ncbi:MAG TPA: hypothetical protein VIS03_17560 [Kiloniellaceae bacterium]
MSQFSRCLAEHHPDALQSEGGGVIADCRIIEALLPGEEDQG